MSEVETNTNNETKEKTPLSEKEVAQKRVFFLLLAICVVIVAFIIWEIVDIALFK